MICKSLFDIAQAIQTNQYDSEIRALGVCVWSERERERERE